MANTDENWKKFLASTEEDDEEVETPGEDETDSTEEDEADDSGQSDETADDTADEDETPEEDDDSEKADGKKKKPAAKDYAPRLKQFLNDDGSLNVEKLETSYIESGKQAVKLDGEVKAATKSIETLQKNYDGLLAAIKAKPDVAKALFGEDGAKKLADSEQQHPASEAAVNPLLKHLEAQMNNAAQKEYNEFIEAHPEAVTDPEKVRLIGDFMKLHGQVYRAQHDGEIPGMKDSLEAAYKYYGWAPEIKQKEDVATAAKKAAATRKSSTAKRPANRRETLMGEEFFARKLGVKLKK
jgi:hypothetical protein